ncbi:hypothetical protein FACS189452_08400 [Bacteroidia bacterium]|nr:hypothetical protein FACS189452_08400 [Bacteroidia bacterium]GHT83069.1 hypothetical protein FACS189467_8490 [Bacteroidia bacterium]
MSKKIFLLLTFVTLAVSSFAETYLGAHYATGISTIYFSPHKNESWRLAPYDAGLVYRYYDSIEFHKYFNIGLQVELNFAARRYRFDDVMDRWVTGTDGSQTLVSDTLSKKIHSQVIEIPVIMQWQFPVTQHFSIYLNGLVYVAYYVKNKAFYKNTEWQDVTERFNYNNWNNFDFGIGGGLGVGYSVGALEIGVDARFVMGISELYPQTIDCYESLPQQILLSFSVVKKF